MLSGLEGPQKAVGLKQSEKIIKQGGAKKAFVANDASASVTAPFLAVCAQHSVPVEYVETMDKLGSACGIEVGAAVAVIL